MQRRPRETLIAEGQARTNGGRHCWFLFYNSVELLVVMRVTRLAPPTTFSPPPCLGGGGGGGDQLSPHDDSAGR